MSLTSKAYKAFKTVGKYLTKPSRILAGCLAATAIGAPAFAQDDPCATKRYAFLPVVAPVKQKFSIDYFKDGQLQHQIIESPPENKVVDLALAQFDFVKQTICLASKPGDETIAIDKNNSCLHMATNTKETVVIRVNLPGQAESNDPISKEQLRPPYMREFLQFCGNNTPT